MSGLVTLMRAALLAAVVVVLAFPAVAQPDSALAEYLEDGETRSVTRIVGERYEAPITYLPTTSSLARGPAGDPLLMAGSSDPRIDDLVTAPTIVPDSGAMVPGVIERAGPGTFQIAEGYVPAPDPERTVWTLLVQVEEGLPVDADVFAEIVMETLNAPRGWGEIDNVSFARTDQEDDARFVLSLATPATTDVLCAGLPTHGYVSCGRIDTVNINADRWALSTDVFLQAGGTLEEYRTYLINHEVGHTLGHPHVSCAGQGQLAPVMMQQTLRLDGCVPNGWPNP